MLRHVILVPCEPLFCCRPDFIYQIELKAYGLVIPAFVMVVYPIACKSDFSWMTTSLPYVSQKGVSPVGVLTVVLYIHSTIGNSLGHMPFAPLSRVLIILSKDRLVTSTCPLAYGWAGEE